MFGMGGSEIIVILIVALIFLGPDKLPEAAKQLSKGIRDIKRSTRDIQQTIENDEQFGGAIRDIKSALRGEDAPMRPKQNIAQASAIAVVDATAASDAAATDTATDAAPATHDVSSDAGNAPAPTAADVVVATVSLPTIVGEAALDSTLSANSDEDRAADAAVAAMIRPAPGAIAKGSRLSTAADAGASEHDKEEKA
ncbi:MAG TPA: twin-arginine translocase TatA/TatE family subunit [Kofleriaceae bacterium]|nr:twin-arginine translocase TatA/TatE family subunit [Kofleriaceae bacterium]